MTKLDEFISSNRERFEQDLRQLLKIPSISTDGSYRAQVAEAADWVLAQFVELGFRSELIPTDGHPLVYAESAPVPNRPVALVYGHYDVQPPDPLDEWISPPFEPTVRDGNIYARGATDDKGQMLTHVKAVQSWIETEGTLPMQVKFLIEGEEEIGSPNLSEFLQSPEAAKRLACDVIVISDTSQFSKGHPAITYGLRGIAYFELILTGPKQDLHSGTFGGAVANPANALTKMLSALVNDEGKIQVPGFYDDVEALSDRERSQFSALPFNERSFMEQLGVAALAGERGYSTLERRWARPSFDINGIRTGYQGEGAKTVLPNQASAKFSFRLVPQQNPDAIAASLRTMLEELCPAGITLELKEMHHAPGFTVPLDSPYIDAAAKAIEQGFGHSPVFIREGGSIPIVSRFTDTLDAPTLLLGWGLNDDNTHSPNEKFSLADYHRGIKSSAHLWYELSRVAV
ncbi:MAG: dipeptidase [Pirellulaceae bacterium]